MKFFKITPSLVIVALFSFSPLASVAAEEESQPEVKTLEGLLQQVEQFHKQETEINSQRESKFKQNKQTQKELLAQAKAELKNQQDIADDLKTSFDNNEKALVVKDDQLRLRIGNLGDVLLILHESAYHIGIEMLARALTYDLRRVFVGPRGFVDAGRADGVIDI